MLKWFKRLFKEDAIHIHVHIDGGIDVKGVSKTEAPECKGSRGASTYFNSGRPRKGVRDIGTGEIDFGEIEVPEVDFGEEDRDTDRSCGDKSVEK